MFANFRKKAVAGTVKVLGSENPDSLTMMANLQALYHELGQNDEGDVLVEKVYRLELNIFGEKHPCTLKIMKSVASIYERRGLLEVAANRGRDILTSTPTPSVESVETVIFSNSLASTYEASGRLEQAVQLLELSLNLRNQVLRELHPAILECRDNLVGLYLEMGWYENSINVGERTLETHQWTWEAVTSISEPVMSTLSLAYLFSGRLDCAEAQVQKLLNFAVRTYGDKNTLTLVYLNNMGEVFRKQGRLDEAVSIHAQVLKTK